MPRDMEKLDPGDLRYLRRRVLRLLSRAAEGLADLAVASGGSGAERALEAVEGLRALFGAEGAMSNSSANVKLGYNAVPGRGNLVELSISIGARPGAPALHLCSPEVPREVFVRLCRVARSRIPEERMFLADVMRRELPANVLAWVPGAAEEAGLDPARVLELAADSMEAEGIAWAEASAPPERAG